MAAKVPARCVPVGTRVTIGGLSDSHNGKKAKVLGFKETDGVTNMIIELGGKKTAVNPANCIPEGCAALDTEVIVTKLGAETYKKYNDTVATVKGYKEYKDGGETLMCMSTQTPDGTSLVLKPKNTVERFPPGTKGEVFGLRTHANLNNKKVIVEGVKSAKGVNVMLVKFEDDGSKRPLNSLNLRERTPEGLQPVGTSLVIQGLNTLAHLNGQACKVLRFKEVQDMVCYQVKIDNGETKILKPGNVKQEGEGDDAAKQAEEKAKEAEQAKQKAEDARKAEEAKLQEEAARKAAEEKEAQKKAEEETAREEAEAEAARKEAEEKQALQKAQEETARKEAEEKEALQKAQEETARKEAEEKEALRKAEEETARKAEEARVEEQRRKDEDAKKKDEEQRQSEEARKAEETRAGEEQKRAEEEAARKAEQEKAAADEQQRLEEDKQRAARKEEADRKRVEAASATEERKRKEAEERVVTVQRLKEIEEKEKELIHRMGVGSLTNIPTTQSVDGSRHTTPAATPKAANLEVAPEPTPREPSVAVAPAAASEKPPRDEPSVAVPSASVPPSAAPTATPATPALPTQSQHTTPATPALPSPARHVSSHASTAIPRAETAASLQNTLMPAPSETRSRSNTMDRGMSMMPSVDFGGKLTPRSLALAPQIDPNDTWVKRLEAVYAKHMPRKRDTMKVLLQRYDGREDVLFDQLVKKYKDISIVSYREPMGTDDIQVAAVAGHSKLRAQHDADSLKFDARCAGDAMRHAASCIRTGNVNKDGARSGGQSIWMSQVLPHETEPMVVQRAFEEWYGELGMLVTEPHKAARCGQLLWRAVKQVGVGLCIKSGLVCVVANYSPGGKAVYDLDPTPFRKNLKIVEGNEIVEEMKTAPVPLALKPLHPSPLVLDPKPVPAPEPAPEPQPEPEPVPEPERKPEPAPEPKASKKAAARPVPMKRASPVSPKPRLQSPPTKPTPMSPLRLPPRVEIPFTDADGDYVKFLELSDGSIALQINRQQPQIVKSVRMSQAGLGEHVLTVPELKMAVVAPKNVLAQLSKLFTNAGLEHNLPVDTQAGSPRYGVGGGFAEPDKVVRFVDDGDVVALRRTVGKEAAVLLEVGKEGTTPDARKVTSIRVIRSEVGIGLYFPEIKRAVDVPAMRDIWDIYELIEGAAVRHDLPLPPRVSAGHAVSAAAIAMMMVMTERNREVKDEKIQEVIKYTGVQERKARVYLEHHDYDVETVVVALRGDEEEQVVAATPPQKRKKLRPRPAVRLFNKGWHLQFYRGDIPLRGIGFVHEVHHRLEREVTAPFSAHMLGMTLLGGDTSRVATALFPEPGPTGLHVDECISLGIDPAVRRSFMTSFTLAMRGFGLEFDQRTAGFRRHGESHGDAGWSRPPEMDRFRVLNTKEGSKLRPVLTKIIHSLCIFNYRRLASGLVGYLVAAVTEAPNHLSKCRDMCLRWINALHQHVSPSSPRDDAMVTSLITNVNPPWRITSQSPSVPTLRGVSQLGTNFSTAFSTPPAKTRPPPIPPLQMQTPMTADAGYSMNDLQTPAPHAPQIPVPLAEHTEHPAAVEDAMLSWLAAVARPVEGGCSTRSGPLPAVRLEENAVGFRILVKSHVAVTRVKPISSGVIVSVVGDGVPGVGEGAVLADELSTVVGKEVVMSACMRTVELPSKIVLQTVRKEEYCGCTVITVVKEVEGMREVTRMGDEGGDAMGGIMSPRRPGPSLRLVEAPSAYTVYVRSPPEGVDVVPDVSSLRLSLEGAPLPPFATPDTIILVDEISKPYTPAARLPPQAHELLRPMLARSPVPRCIPPATRTIPFSRPVMPSGVSVTPYGDAHTQVKLPILSANTDFEV